jgi:hypothetical protein
MATCQLRRRIRRSGVPGSIATVAVYLSETLAEEVIAFPETRYGEHTVTVTLSTGKSFSGVRVAGGREVVRVDGHDEIPFSGEQVVSVEDDSRRP